MNTERTSEAIICQRKPSDILLERHGPQYSLPRVAIAGYQRTAPQVISQLKEGYGFEGLVLFAFSGDSANMYHCLDGTFAKLSPRMEWTPISGLSVEQFQEPSDYSGVRKMLTLAESYRSGAVSGPFGRTGWVKDLFTWASFILASQQIKLTGEYEQLNSGPSFSLLKLPTTDNRALWFKAVGEPNTRECRIVTTLCRICPEFFPRLLGVRSDWNGWLMADGGTALGEQDCVAAWEQASVRLARLQLATRDSSQELLAAGCRDLRLETLHSRLDSFFAVGSEFMRQQAKTPPAILSDHELGALQDCTKELLDELAQIGISRSFGHLDFGPHNILFGEQGVFFIDLAEVCVTHPLFTFQYLLDCFSRSHAREQDTVEIMKRRYLAEWGTGVSKAAFDISYVLTPLWYAMGCISNVDDSHNPTRIAKWTRSLLRLTYSRAQGFIRTRSRAVTRLQA